MKAWIFTAAVVAAAPAAGQQMYRCTADDGSVSFQDKPCAPGAAQSTPRGQSPLQAPAAAGPMRLKPLDTLSPPERAQYEALFFRYAEVFRIVGRAQACGHPAAAQRMDELGRQMSARHGPHHEILMSMLIGMGAGMENKLIGNEPDQTRPPAPVPCDIIAGHMSTLRLPEVPAVLVLAPGLPVDRVVKQSEVSTGRYRIVRRNPADGSARLTVVIHNERVVFESALDFENETKVDAPTPVLLVAVSNPALRCPDRARHLSWHAISLPPKGDAPVARLDADCMDVRAYHRGAGFQRPSACIDMGPRGNLRYFAVDDSGRISRTSEPPPGSCR